MTGALPSSRLARAGDPETSLIAAIKASKASYKAVLAVKRVMVDGVERMDEELWRACREQGYISSFDTVRHGRLSLSETGLLAWTGETRITTNGSPSNVWRWSADHELAGTFDDVVANPEWRQRLSAAQAGRGKQLTPKQAEAWVKALRVFVRSAREKGLNADEEVIQLGKWLVSQASDG
jgi:hypothetical protein